MTAKLLLRRVAAIQRQLDAGALALIHDEAFPAADEARKLAGLVSAEGSPVAEGDRGEVAGKAGRLAWELDALHEAADNGDAVGTRAHLEAAQGLVRDVAAFVPRQYVCPMRCENSGVSGEPGKCPVCGMTLKLLTEEVYTVSLGSAPWPIEPEKPVVLTMALKDPLGAPVKDLEVVHEKVLHLLMVSRDLSWFAHEHPERQGDGSFRLEFTFPRPGAYMLFLDFTPPGVGQQVVAAPVNVEGELPKWQRLRVDSGDAKVIDGYGVSFSSDGPLVAGKDGLMRFTITRGDEPVTDLEPFLGTMGHLVVISQNLATFIHSHPVGGHVHGVEEPTRSVGVPGSGPASERRATQEPPGSGGVPGAEEAKAGTGPTVEFHVIFDQPGVYKAFGQFQHKGKVITAPFTISVAGPPGSPAPAAGPKGPPAGRHKP